MAATILDIADAVVTQINATTWSQTLTVPAQRLYQPIFQVSDLTTLRVSVVPKGLASKTLDRSRDTFEYQIDVAVQKKTDMSLGAHDALMGLVEEIADHFRTTPLAALPSARCTEVKNDPIYSPLHLEQLRAFTSLITLTFTVWR